MEGFAVWTDFSPGHLPEIYRVHWKTLLIYLDDVIVISPDFTTHISRLQEVFNRLRGAGLKLKLSKCTVTDGG